jgi:DNA-binding MarR family transcriptional regulator
MDDEHLLARKLLTIIHRVRHSLDAELRHVDQEYRIDPAHFGVLMRLRRRVHNVSELADQLKVSLPSMSKTVTALVKRGWVERARSQEDRRVVQLHLTDDGRAVLGKMRDLADNAIAKILSSLSQEERQLLSAGLDALYRALGEPFDATPPASPQSHEKEE